MRCKNCNKRLPDGATFCPRCGENVLNDDVSRYVSDKSEAKAIKIPQEKPNRYKPEKRGYPTDSRQASSLKQPATDATKAPAEKSADKAPEDKSAQPMGYPQNTYNKQTVFPTATPKPKNKKGNMLILIITLIFAVRIIIRIVTYLVDNTSSILEFNSLTETSGRTPVSGITESKTTCAPNPADYFDCEPTIYNKYTEYGSNGYYQTFFFELDENYPEPYISFLELLESDYDFELNYTFDDDSETMKEGIQHHYIYYTGEEKVGEVAVAIHEERSANIIIDIYRKNSFNYVMFTFYYGEGIELESAKEKSPYKVKISELYQ